MTDNDRDTQMRMAAFEHVRELHEVHDQLTANELKPGFVFDGERIPLINPQRGIFKPQQMRFLLSIKTVFPRPGSKIWYDDQREVHRQIFEGDETVDYAFMGRNPEAADPDYRLHVSDRLLGQSDGPMLEALKRLNGGTIHLPSRVKDRPDRDRLALRFDRFKAVA